MSKTLRELREELSDELIKDILSQFNVEPRLETENYIVFPTCCHNLEGGSPKLYYYKNTKLFKCYTECNEMFDIFHLLIKMYHLRGKEITLHDAVRICNCDDTQDIDYSRSEVEDYKYMLELSGTVTADVLPELKHYDSSILNRYSFDLNGFKPWLEEGISIEQIQKFGIKYDPIQNCIVIPNYDINGNLIGVRGRFLDADAPAKYAPLWFGNQCLSYPTSRCFYGLRENKDAILKKHTVVIVEGEKSVLKYGGFYKDNIALATLGKNISASHIAILLKLNVKRVILSYDADYETEKELEDKKVEYKKIANILTPYFETSILMDYDLQLNYKDSPLDNTKEYFEKLIKQRYKM